MRRGRARRGSSVDAVETVIRVLEDSPLFNAGKGAVLNNEGNVELDASIMSGADINAGGVAGLKSIKNPIIKMIMTQGKNLLLLIKAKKRIPAIRPSQEALV